MKDLLNKHQQMIANAQSMEGNAPATVAGSVGSAVPGTESSSSNNSTSSSMGGQTACKAGDLVLEGALLVVSS